jgi:hypothetical protein
MFALLATKPTSGLESRRLWGMFAENLTVRKLGKMVGIQGGHELASQP